MKPNLIFRKIKLVILSLISLCTPVVSQELTTQQAIHLANSLWNVDSTKGKRDALSLVKEYKRSGKTYLYIISQQERGSVIIVNEERLNGIIGYSDNVLPEDAQEIPPAFNTLLQLYMDIVDSVRTADQNLKRKSTQMRATQG